MNKHMKLHARRLNIKTTELANMTAVFRLKKRTPPAAADSPDPPAMDVDEEGCLPEPDIQVGDLEAISEEPTLQSDSDETDDDAGTLVVTTFY